MKKTSIIILSMLAVAASLSGCGDKEKKNESTVDQVQQSVESHATTASGETAEANLKAALEFEETEYDFGTINEGEVASHTYSFTNVGEAPLIIQSATASCGCTVPSWPKEPILVGESGEIEVHFNSSNKPNMQSKTITIIANTEPKTTYLKIKGMVTPKADQAMGPVRQN